RVVGKARSTDPGPHGRPCARHAQDLGSESPRPVGASPLRIPTTPADNDVPLLGPVAELVVGDAESVDGLADNLNEALLAPVEPVDPLPFIDVRRCRG